MKSILVRCDGAKLPKKGLKGSFDKTVNISKFGKDSNLNIKVTNIKHALLSSIDSIPLDLLNIASFVYIADSEVSRGNAEQVSAKSWIRNMTFIIPCRNPDLWNSKEVKSILSDMLSFLSGDRYHFYFVKNDPMYEQDYIECEDNDLPEYKGEKADSVALFSGGLDSLAGLVDDISHGKRTVVVSHKSRNSILSTQKGLLDLLKERFPDWYFPHLSLWLSREGKSDCKEYTQRSRSFLYFCLATAIAHQLNIDKVRYYENGIISINLPLSNNNVGTFLTRTTHPKFINYFSKLVETVLDKKISYTNPFLFKTKADVVKTLHDNNCQELIEGSVSCAHSWHTTKLKRHCGTCSQCIDRRYAVAYNKLEECDPIHGYKKDLFLDELEDKTGDKACAIHHAKTVKQIKTITEHSFTSKYPEIYDVIKYVNLPTEKAFESVYSLFSRWADQCEQVIVDKISDNSSQLFNGELPPSCLISMIGKQTHLENTDVKGITETRTLSKFPTPDGTKWENVKIDIYESDALTITVGKIIKRYTYAELGFNDKRKRNTPDKQWITLKYLSEQKGEIHHGNTINEATKSRFKILRKNLIEIMNINDDIPVPFNRQNFSGSFCDGLSLPRPFRNRTASLKKLYLFMNLKI